MSCPKYPRSLLLLFVRLSMIHAGTIGLASPLAQAPLTRKAQVVSGACQESGRSNPQIGQLLTTLPSHQTAEAYDTLGVLYAQQRQLRCAIPAFEQAIKLDPRDWRARYNFAVALAGGGETKRAIEQLQILLRQNPDSAAALNMLGSLLEKEGTLEAAADELKAALKRDPGLAPAALTLAHILMTQKRYSAALVYLDDALKSSPPAELEEQLSSAVAVAQAENGNFESAVETLGQVIKSHPDAADAYFNLATLYAKKGPSLGYEKAIANFQAALRIDPHYDEARYSMAKVLVEIGRFSEALFYLNEYTRDRARDAEGFHLLGSAYAGVSQPAKAVEALERAERLKPTDAQIRYDLGAVLAKSGRTNESIEQLRVAERLNPGFPDTHYQLAVQLRKSGDLVGSKQELERFQRLKHQELAATSAGSLNNEGNRLLQEGKAREAAAAYLKAVELDPVNAQWRYNLSLARAKLGDREGQKQALIKAVELDPNLANAHNDLGLAYLTENRFREAEREFHAALEINPRFAEAQNNLGVVYSQQGKDSEAGTLFRQAGENDPTYTKAFVNLALLIARHGNLAAAKDDLEQSLKVSPNDASALTALGMIEGKMGHHEESLRALKKVASLNPESADGHLNVGIALADQFDLQGALKEFSEAIRLDPNAAAAYYNKGRVLYDLNRRQEALPFLKTACRLEPNYASALYLLALVLGTSPQAKDVLEKLVSVDPENAEAHSMRAQALLREGNTRAAITEWKAAVQLDSRNSSSLYNLSRLLSSVHDPEAKEYTDRFQELQRARQVSDRVQTLNNFALEAATAHKWLQAVEQLQESINACGDCKQLSILHRNLGLIYARSGDVRDAERQLSAALKLSPQDADAQRALQILRGLPEPPNSPTK